MAVGCGWRSNVTPHCVLPTFVVRVIYECVYSTLMHLLSGGHTTLDTIVLHVSCDFYESFDSFQFVTDQ